MILEKYQKGQAIVYLVAFIGVISLAVAYAFNSFQVVNEKTRLQNTVDAAAYSVAMVEAKDLNFKAYTNRAMVANQVAIAQAVSVVSWIRFLDVSAENIATITSWIPVVGAITSAISEAVAGVKEVLEPAMQAMATGLDVVITLLEESQHLMHAATLVIADETLKEIVNKNDPDVDTSISLGDVYLMSEFVGKHNSFTSRFDPEVVRKRSGGTKKYNRNKARMDNFRSITMNSVDGFVRRRDDDIPGIPNVNLLVFQAELRRGGGTSLVGEASHAQYGSWIAMDTLSVHTRNWRCSFSGCGWRSWREVFPVGWGAAKNARSEEDIEFDNHRSAANYRNSWDRNRTASRTASSEYSDASEVGNYLGLRAFYDLAVDGLLTKGPGIKLVLSKPDEKLRTTKQIGVNTGSLDIEKYGGLEGNNIASFAAATSYFARRNDASNVSRPSSIREYANAYNPYWRAKLEKVSDTEKIKLQAISKKY